MNEGEFHIPFSSEIQIDLTHDVSGECSNGHSMPAPSGGGLQVVRCYCGKQAVQARPDGEHGWFIKYIEP